MKIGHATDTSVARPATLTATASLLASHVRVTCPLSGLLHVFGVLPYDTTYQLHIPGQPLSPPSHCKGALELLTFLFLRTYNTFCTYSYTPFAPSAFLFLFICFSFVVYFQRELDFVRFPTTRLYF
jgi:hypothetical protein